MGEGGVCARGKAAHGAAVEVALLPELRCSALRWVSGASPLRGRTAARDGARAADSESRAAHGVGPYLYARGGSGARADSSDCCGVTTLEGSQPRSMG